MRTTTCPSERIIDRLAAVLAILAGTAAFVVPVQAQSGPQRNELERIRSSLHQASTLAAAKSLGQTSEAGQSTALRLVRRGLVSVRLGELSGDRRYFDEAIQSFDAAVLRAPAWPYPWFGLALAKRALSEQGVLVKASANQLDGVSYYLGFTQAIVATFARDSLFAPAMDLLRDELNRQGERQQPEVLLTPLQRAARSPDATPLEFMVLARALRDRGRNDSALAMIERYRIHGGDRGIASLEQAHTLALEGAFPAAASAYLTGLEQPTAQARAAYRLDLRWIAEQGELSEFDRTPDDSLADWVVDFWRWRDQRELRQPGERLAEHLRRWAVVERDYRVDHPERRTQFRRVWAASVGPCSPSDYYALDDFIPDSELRSTDGRSRERLYDDRAYVYMRHGEPALKVRGLGLGGVEQPELKPEFKAGVVDESNVTAADTGGLKGILDDERAERARANESWLYWFGGARRVFNFEGSHALGLQAPTALSVEPLVDEHWLASRSILDPRYEKLSHVIGLRALPPECRPLYQTMRATMRRDAGVGLTSDSYTLLFPHELEPVVQSYAMGRPDLGAGRILVVFALPGRQLTPDSAGADRADGVLYPVQVRVSATDTTSRISRMLDTTRQFVAHDTLRAGSYLTGFAELEVPPGEYQVGTALFQPVGAVGGVIRRDGVDLRVPASGLYLGDLILGRSGSGLEWTYQGQRIPLNPLAEFSRDQAAELFYEVGGLRPGQSYVSAVTLQPVKGKSGEQTLRLRFSETATQDGVLVHRTLGLSQLRKGQYRLTVELLEEGSSRRAHREQYLNIGD